MGEVAQEMVKFGTGLIAQKYDGKVRVGSIKTNFHCALDSAY
jgi:hypothetical protein